MSLQPVERESPPPPHGRSVEEIYGNYVRTFATKDPARIVLNHAEDGTFWLHAGQSEIQGRSAISQAFAGFFAQFPQFDFEVHRVIFTDRNWILDWSVKAVMTARDGTRHAITFDALDVIDVDADGLVARKDTFVNSPQLHAQLAALA